MTWVVELSSVLNYCMALEKDGYRVPYLPVDRDELLKLVDLENAVTDESASRRALRVPQGAVVADDSRRASGTEPARWN